MKTSLSYTVFSALVLYSLNSTYRHRLIFEIALGDVRWWQVEYGEVGWYKVVLDGSKFEVESYEGCMKVV
jgi:hypothetical protein